MQRGIPRLSIALPDQSDRPAKRRLEASGNVPSCPKIFSKVLAAAYDCVVIGSGLAGMTAAVTLARSGRSVLLLEQHYKIGGMATWFKRPGGHIFDISLHGFPVGMVKSCRRYWTARDRRVDRAIEEHPLRQSDVLADHVLRSRKTSRGFWSSGSPCRQPRVTAFFDAARNMNFFDDQSTTVGELFERFFPGRDDVMRLLMEPITYANGSTLEDPAISYGIVFSNFMSKGVFTFQGGTDRLIRLMHEELLQQRRRCPHPRGADRVLVQNGRVTGVEVAGRTIGCPAVVSNSNLKSTIFNLVGQQHFDRKFVDDAQAVRLNNSSCQVYMALRPGDRARRKPGRPFVQLHGARRSGPIGCSAATSPAGPIRSITRAPGRAAIAR